MKLMAQWKLTDNALEETGRYNGVERHIRFPGDEIGGALFNGKSSALTIPNLVLPDKSPFSLTAWVNTQDAFTGVYGGIASQYDEKTRRGFNLWMGGSATAYSSASNTRNVHFGIDNSFALRYIDCGKPCATNTLISALASYKGKLYAAIADAVDPHDACHVYVYEGGDRWTDCGRVGDELLTLTVRALIVHDGALYAGTGVWDWTKANDGISGPSHVYRYEGGTQWRDLGIVGKGNMISAFASFKGNLYTGDNNGDCYRYDGDTQWTYCGSVIDTDENPYQDRIDTLMVHQGEMYAGCAGINAFMYRYEGGASWTCVARNAYNTTQLHKLQTHGNKLLLGTWPTGKVLAYDEGSLADTGQLGIGTERYLINEVNDLAYYNGKLYGGALPKAELYRYDGDWNWTLMRRMVTNDNWNPEKLASWCRVPCFNVFDGKLFCGTSTCEGIAEANPHYEVGRVIAMEAGKCVSYNDDMGAGWHHIAAVRDAEQLRLFVDGSLVAQSDSFDGDSFSIQNDACFTIGSGAQASFNGRLRDVRMYDGALSVKDVRQISE